MRDRERDRQTDRQTERQRDREIRTQIDNAEGVAAMLESYSVRIQCSRKKGLSLTPAPLYSLHAKGSGTIEPRRVTEGK